MKYSEFKTEKDFKKFLRENKILIADYFEKYEPKFDLFTNKQIPFKDRKTYFQIDFLDKRHMAKWLGNQNKPEARSYILSKLRSKAKEKDWKFAPCQTECRSIREIPALNILEYCKDKKLWGQFGLTRRFEYGDTVYEHESLDGAILGYDSREQKPLKINDLKYIKSKFDFGDYCFLNEPYFCNVFIERKSIQDLWGTISKGYERFCREVERAKDQDGYLIVVVDYPFSKAQSYNHNKKFSKATAEFIFHRIREILQSYDNIQFVFSGDRAKSVGLIKEIGKLGSNAKKYDLQYLLDVKQL